jgi:hypothetical protein
MTGCGRWDSVMGTMMLMLGRWRLQHQLVDHGRIACIVAKRLVASTFLRLKELLEPTAEFVEACTKTNVFFTA